MKSYALLLVIELFTLNSAAQKPVGIFENHNDIGKVLHAKITSELLLKDIV
ncbi:hypothetical protein GVN20_24420 [Runella sp. CRIBMP]|uniref:hypothetical protein n=1 Tax=Runella sp. CRIBMP TaxID=2683261 RepID=UPI0014131BDF|nr:hypothetical protein [Runella sp. CRIBMP]NBB22522.1 hypothetical protein [Runella sp. CRIBMP]